MPRSRHAFGFGRVNLLKKVNIAGEWKFCPAVVESGRRLNDLVRVNGQIETHPEGSYYLDWRQQGKRRRQPVRNRALVFEQARLKALELEAQRKPCEIASTPSQVPPPLDAPSAPVHQPVAAGISSNSISATHLIFKGIESYLEDFIGAAVWSHLASLGMTPREASPPIQPSKISAPPPASSDEERSEPGATPANANGKILIAEAIESYLKDLEFEGCRTAAARTKDLRRIPFGARQISRDMHKALCPRSQSRRLP